MKDSIKIVNDMLKNAAKIIGDYMDYDTYPKNETKLADLYIEAKNSGDTEMAEGYLSALMLRHWKDISKLYESTKNSAFALAREDFISKLYERIEYACKYASWKTNPKINAQQCINRSIATEIKNIFYFSNLDKHKVNANLLSLDNSLNNGLSSKSSDGNNCDLINYVPDSLRFGEILDIKAVTNGATLFSKNPYQDDGQDLIQYFINNNRIVEAVILDNIANGDCFKDTQSTIKRIDEETGEKIRSIQHSTEFKPYKLVQILSSLPANYYNYFINKYTVKPEIAQIAISSIEKANNSKLYRFIDKTLSGARKDIEAGLI